MIARVKLWIAAVIVACTSLLSIIPSVHSQAGALTTIAFGEQVSINDLVPAYSSPVAYFTTFNRESRLGQIWQIELENQFSSTPILTEADAVFEQLALSPQETNIAVSSDTPAGSTVAIYQIPTMVVQTSIEIVRGQVTSLAFSPSGQYLAVSIQRNCCYSETIPEAPRDTILEIYDVMGGAVIASVPIDPFNAQAYGVAFLGSDDLVAYSTTHAVQVLNIRSNDQSSIMLDAGAPDTLLYETNNTLTFREVENVVLWNFEPVTRGGSPQDRRILAPTNPNTPEWITAYDINTDTSLLAMGHINGDVSLWDAATGTMISTAAGYGRVIDIAFSRDNSTLISSHVDGQIAIRSIAELLSQAQGLRESTPAAQATALACVTPESSARTAITVENVARISLLHVLSHEQPLNPPQALDVDPSTHVSFNCQSTQLAISSSGSSRFTGSVSIYDLSSFAVIHHLTLSERMPGAIAFNQDGSKIAFITHAPESARIELWANFNDVPQIVANSGVYDAYSDLLNALYWGRDFLQYGSIVGDGLSGYIQGYSFSVYYPDEDLTLPRSIDTAHVGTYPVVRFSPDGEMVAAVSAGNAVLVDVATGDALAQLDNVGRSSDFIFHKAGSEFTYVANDGIRRCHLPVNASQSELLDCRFVAPNDTRQEVSVVAIATNAQENLLVLSRSDGSIEFWNSDSGAVLSRLHLSEQVEHMLFSPDDSLLAVIDARGNVALYSISES